MLKQHIIMAFRNFIRKPEVNLINLIGLSVSLALVIMLSFYSFNEFTTDHYHKNAERIFVFPRTDQHIHTSFLLKEQIELSVPTVDLIVRVGQHWGSSTFQVEGHDPFDFNLLYTDNEFFNLFNYKPLVGNLGDALKTPLTLVVSEKFAEQLFGTIDVVGKTVKFNNNQLFTIKAVIKSPIGNSIFSFEAITSMATKHVITPNSEEFSNWGHTSILTFLRIMDDVKPESVHKSIVSALPENAKNMGYNPTQLIPLKNLYFSNYIHSFLHFGDKKKVITLTLAGLLILVIGLFNYVNISASNWEERIRQVGVKKVVGAKRSSIFLSLLTESVLFFIAALLIAFSLTYVFSKPLTNYTGIHFNYDILLYSELLGVLAGSTLLLSILFSLLSALRISSSNAIDNLKNVVNTRDTKSHIRAFLVIGQFTIAIVLIAFTMLVKKQIDFGSSNLGMNQENIAGVKLTSQLKDKRDVLRNKIMENPFVENISFTQYYPNNTIESWDMEGEYSGVKKHFAFDIFNADSAFFNLLGIQPIMGHLFSDNLASYLNKAVVNETFVREHKMENPIGEKIPLITGECEIIGVVKDFHYKSVNVPIAPLIIRNNTDASFCLVSLNSSGFKGLHHSIQSIKNVVNDLSPSFPVEVSFFDQAIESMYQSELQFRKTFTLFAGIAIIICCMGIFAMSLSTSQKRTKEIGIRKVNGAKITEILAMLNRNFVKWVAIAFFIATPIAYYAMNKWLQNFAYKTELNWWIFALAGLLALGIALLTVSIQSWKTARRNPVEALRYE
ncbi:MAG: ABC transporter permease [Prolixibacteraceae bacterium]|nr:ABC transporter permease [Prolixibacteraceae bacterium]